MAPGWVVLVLVLSALGACGAVPPREPGQDRGLQWVWGAAGEVQDEALQLPRKKRDESEQQPRGTAVPGSDDVHSPKADLLGSVPPPAPGTTTSLKRELVVPTTTDPLDETDTRDLLPSAASPPVTNTSLQREVPTTTDPLDETDTPDLLPSTASPPTTNTNLKRELVVLTTTDPLDETDTPDLLPSTTPAVTNTSLQREFVVPTTTDPLDETDGPDLLLSTTPPPTTNAILHRGRVAATTANPLDETDGPDLLPGSTTPAEPGTQAAPQNNSTTIPVQLLSLAEEGTVTSSSSVGPRSATSAAFGSTTTASKKIKKSRASPAPTSSSPWDTTPRGTAGPPPWDPSGLMGKCLLAILLLALVAATFMVCTGVLGARLWRRARTARRQLSHTEMVCISSLMADGEAAANGPRARRLKPLLDGGSEFDGDNLTLSSFLPEHS